MIGSITTADGKHCLREAPWGNSITNYTLSIYTLSIYTLSIYTLSIYTISNRYFEENMRFPTESARGAFPSVVCAKTVFACAPVVGRGPVQRDAVWRDRRRHWLSVESGVARLDL